ncbi:hypothetical protein Rahaq2_0999 [Rahnella aquatilis CIP 78.65 = ATCC 33071]|uniref:Uncharacterized protein n=1 Tax=Rahnella aquatilis (strain ATCC 33071 / DSM 4594 / JCM 1683 / NBRC 105701 / NCIMB 13365 / CIP 78.65) TaxID=745277 RepID=H2IYF7_RAHAC|nr:hypothetical protein Rahaq2_0999 [Rahnella aquatilis CIP 78.65 = ATCC 33071]
MHYACQCKQNYVQKPAAFADVEHLLLNFIPTRPQPCKHGQHKKSVSKKDIA